MKETESRERSRARPFSHIIEFISDRGEGKKWRGCHEMRSRQDGRRKRNPKRDGVKSESMPKADMQGKSLGGSSD